MSEAPALGNVTTAATRLIIGIDAGGTKTVALLARADGQMILGQGVGGPGNIRAVGAERVTAALTTAVAAAFAAAGLSPTTIAAAAIGAAGAARPDDRAAVETCLRAALAADRYVVTNDAAIALRAAIPTGPAVLLIAGTGSIGYGRTAAGREVRAGGWGYLLDDAGSAYAIGLAGLGAVLRAHDGRDPQTTLSATLLVAWGLAEPEGIIGRVYQLPPPRDEIAALAPLVAAAARAGDPVAAAIVANAGDALGALAIATLGKLAPAPGATIPLVTSGGLLHACADLLLPPLLGTITRHGYTVAHHPATREAAIGALAFARDLL